MPTRGQTSYDDMLAAQRRAARLERRAQSNDPASAMYRQRQEEQARLAGNSAIQFSPTAEGLVRQSRGGSADIAGGSPEAVPMPPGVDMQPMAELPDIDLGLSQPTESLFGDIDSSLSRTSARLEAIISSGLPSAPAAPVPTWQRNLAIYGVNENQRVGAQNAINAGIALPRMPPAMGTQPMSPGRVDVDVTGNNGLRVRQMQIPQQYGGGVGQATFPATFPDTDQFNFGS